MKFRASRSRVSSSNKPAFLLVLLLHALILYGLLSHQWHPAAQRVETLFVNFIPATKPPPEKSKPVPMKRIPENRPSPAPLAVQAPVVNANERVVPPPPAISSEIAAPQRAIVQHVTLTSELAVSCPERTPPSYPAQSRRMSETGTVVLQVELNETGQIIAVRINQSSAYARLDEAAISAVKSWRCNPASRNGQAVRATALQPFKFSLESH